MIFRCNAFHRNKQVKVVFRTVNLGVGTRLVAPGECSCAVKYKVTAYTGVNTEISVEVYCVCFVYKTCAFGSNADDEVAFRILNNDSLAVFHCVGCSQCFACGVFHNGVGIDVVVVEHKRLFAHNRVDCYKSQIVTSYRSAGNFGCFHTVVRNCLEVVFRVGPTEKVEVVADCIGRIQTCNYARCRIKVELVCG